MDLVFSVPSSRGDGSYRVRLYIDGDVPRMSCECAAYLEGGTLCRHREMICTGKFGGVTTPPAFAENLAAFLAATSWVDDLATLAETDTEIAKLQSRKKSIRRKIAREMGGR